MNILVVAAHPDDEILGCGGTMARHAAEGDLVKVVFMTNGVSSRKVASDSPEVQERRAAAEKALRVVGVGEATYLDFPDNAMDAVSRLEVAQGLEQAVEGFVPDVVYTHHPADLNIDHVRAHEAVMVCYRPQPGRPQPSIYLFEVSSSTGWASPQMGQVFVPRRVVNIEAYMSQKMEALQAYALEMREAPHARSMDALTSLAQFRGSQVGFRLGEAFDVAREMVL